jgi:D-alanine--poly(phosphoribitol) ligase subunit 1
VSINNDMSLDWQVCLCEQSKTTSMIVDLDYQETLRKIAAHGFVPTRVVFLKGLTHHRVELSHFWARTQCYQPREDVLVARLSFARAADNPYAYLMYTSGTTGVPKGVEISHQNALAYLHTMRSRCGAKVGDRFSQIAALSFDFSIHEVFVCWAAGACLCPYMSSHYYGLPKFLQEQKITHWASVPSVALALYTLHQAKPYDLPDLKYSAFCGEALTAAIAKFWHQLAPHALLDNIYGPTEATVACMGYFWNPSCQHEIVPIGQPFADQQIALFNPQGQPVNAPGEVGELYIAGTQVAGGYFERPDLTAAKFTYNATQQLLYYKTGDLAAFDPEYGFVYHGRIDDQLQIRGYRVERQEIEVRLAELLDTPRVAVVPEYFPDKTLVKSVSAFVEGKPENYPADIQDKLRDNLPAYMVPSTLQFRAELPRNKNGKIDYGRLR